MDLNLDKVSSLFFGENKPAAPAPPAPKKDPPKKDPPDADASAAARALGKRGGKKRAENLKTNPPPGTPAEALKNQAKE